MIAPSRPMTAAGRKPRVCSAEYSSNVQTTTIAVASTIVASVPAFRQSSATAAMPSPVTTRTSMSGRSRAETQLVVVAGRTRTRAGPRRRRAGGGRRCGPAGPRPRGRRRRRRPRAAAPARTQRVRRRPRARRARGTSRARPRPSRSRRCGTAARPGPRRSAGSSSSPRMIGTSPVAGSRPVRQPLGCRRLLDRLESASTLGLVGQRAGHRLHEVGMLGGRLVGAPAPAAGSSGPGRAAGSGRAGTSPKRGSESAIRRPARPESSAACASSAPMIRTPSPPGAGRAAGCSRVSRSSS